MLGEIDPVTVKVQGCLRKLNPRRVSRAPKARARAVADGKGVNIPPPAGSRRRPKVVSPYRIGGAAWDFRETAPAIKTVPQTDTGGLVEHTQALERTVLKELGKMPR